MSPHGHGSYRHTEDITPHGHSISALILILIEFVPLLVLHGLCLLVESAPNTILHIAGNLLVDLLHTHFMLLLVNLFLNDKLMLLDKYVLFTLPNTLPLLLIDHLLPLLSFLYLFYLLLALLFELSPELVLF